MEGLQEFLKYREYYDFGSSCFYMKIREGEKHDEAEALLKKIIEEYIVRKVAWRHFEDRTENTEQHSLDIALDIISNMSEEQIDYIATNKIVPNYKEKGKDYILRKYIIREDDDQPLSWFYFRYRDLLNLVENFILAIICPSVKLKTRKAIQLEIERKQREQDPDLFLNIKTYRNYYKVDSILLIKVKDGPERKQAYEAYDNACPIALKYRNAFIAFSVALAYYCECSEEKIKKIEKKGLPRDFFEIRTLMQMEYYFIFRDKTEEECDLIFHLTTKFLIGFIHNDLSVYSEIYGNP